MTPSTLDRYLFRRSTAGALAVVGLVTLLVASLDLLLRLAELTDQPLTGDASRGGLIARYVCYRLPRIVSPLLPLAAVGGALIALVPMLRRGELVALAAGGVSLRRSCRGAFALAALLGVVDLALSDQVAPRLEGPATRAEAQLTGSPEKGRIWRVPDTGATWFASRLWFAADGGRAEQLAVADGHGRLLLATGLVHEPGVGWILLDTVEEGPDAVIRQAQLPAADWLALPYTPAELADRLASRQAMTGSELWARDGRLNRSLAIQRWLRLLIPLLCLCCALPVFVRFENRERSLQACSQALLAAAVPMGILSLGTTAAENGGLPLPVMLGGTLLLAAAPGTWLMWRWRV